MGERNAKPVRRIDTIVCAVGALSGYGACKGFQNLFRVQQNIASALSLISSE